MRYRTYCFELGADVVARAEGPLEVLVTVWTQPGGAEVVDVDARAPHAVWMPTGALVTCDVVDVEDQPCPGS